MSQAYFNASLPKPLIVVSACLTGARVRYDGDDKYQPALYANLDGQVTLSPLCPEQHLGVPRPPVQLVITADGLRAQGVDNAALDVTESLQHFCTMQTPLLDRACGAILKARSPSCGIGSTPWHQQGAIAGYRDGLFAAFIHQHYPWLPRIDEAQLDDLAMCGQFLHRARLVLDAQLAWQQGLLDAFRQHHAGEAGLDPSLLAHLERKERTDD
ncbi:MAG: DUF523 domain-containing protein [Gammaproteobacteria bacterium]|nr:MAG: DUF523 domain-containing protein [Gammaproteobacteria bacterium]